MSTYGPGMQRYAYDLPDSAVAQVPIEPRDRARLLDATGAPVVHRTVADLPDLLEAGDVLVVNDTKVLPARLLLRKSSGGHAEVLLLEPLPSGGTIATGAPADGRPAGDAWGSEAAANGRDAGDDIGGHVAPPGGRSAGDGWGSEAAADGRSAGDTGANGAAGDAQENGPADNGAVAVNWRALVRPGRRLAPGTVLFGQGDEPVIRVGARVEDGCRQVQLLDDPWRHGTLPLPPYIDQPLSDPGRYQTVYAAHPGSVAAPTAGLHLTEDILRRCREKGVTVATVDLGVGLGTFRPITADNPADHVMHAEPYSIPQATLDACRTGRRVVAVGTTTVRALEACAATGSREGRTSLFIHGDYPFAVVDVMLTNFHLPRSSLLLLVEAFAGPRWLALYETALAEGYRFLSFGDAMIVTRAAPGNR